MKARIEKPKPDSPTGEPVDQEGKLHAEIIADLKQRRLYYVHSRMDRPTTTALGVTDFIIAAPNGITHWIEVKRRGGKLTSHQNVTRHILLAAGHRYSLIFSFEEYAKALLTKPE